MEARKWIGFPPRLRQVAGNPLFGWPAAPPSLRPSRCQGRMKLLAMVTDPASIARYLAAVGEATEVKQG